MKQFSKHTTSSIFLITNVFNKHSHEFSINFSWFVKLLMLS